MTQIKLPINPFQYTVVCVCVWGGGGGGAEVYSV